MCLFVVFFTESINYFTSQENHASLAIIKAPIPPNKKLLAAVVNPASTTIPRIPPRIFPNIPIPAQRLPTLPILLLLLPVPLLYRQGHEIYIEAI